MQRRVTGQGANLVGCGAGAGEGLAAFVHARAHTARWGCGDCGGPARNRRGAPQGGAHALCVGRPQRARVVVRLRIDACGAASDLPSASPISAQQAVLHKHRQVLASSCYHCISPKARNRMRTPSIDCNMHSNRSGRHAAPGADGKT